MHMLRAAKPAFIAAALSASARAAQMPFDQARRELSSPDRNARLRTDIADLLALSGDQAALAVVEPLLRDNDPDLARAARRAVARLQAASRDAS